jgi:glutamate-5-semialdehyde dehydrogenase
MQEGTTMGAQASGATAGAENEAASVVPRQEALDAEIREIARRARNASRTLATCPTAVKNAALLAMARSLREHETGIIVANSRDLKAGEANGLSGAMLDRLDLGRHRVAAMAAAVEEVAKLPDPVGQMLDIRTRPNGLRLGQMRAPIGVIGIIYESRPNVTADAGCLCIKSGNAVILRGGSEAFHSNQVIAHVMADAGRSAGLPDYALQFVPTTDRAAVQLLLQLDEDIDVIIPRGGKGLVSMIVERSRIPVIRHLDGNCFIYVDESADLDEAASIIVNAKTQRTGVCNALESLLIHKAVAPDLVPRLVAALREKGVEIRADEAVHAAAGEAAADLKPVTAEDWETEYLDLILSVGVTNSLDDACDFINAHGSHHTDAILTRDHTSAMRFLSAVDSACVFVNASTRFSDGGEFGLGCEIGISTNKLHARGPMGLEELTTRKWIAFGDGQIRT